ncbi:hypothetical protein HPB50_001667 [Hyalomma asiaticum]|uniref:Uncharacterized protein n=1 Tax=Hyalomma asiaticum TaxID=266040 RepID=A0ACB7SGW6_HYAAI|nr:hypothetical protein HPB50_001667 [Hyalomma asiaticum]
MPVHSTLYALLLIGLLSLSASQQMLDLNPDLAPFQDDSECFPLEQSWHQIYRDFEEDPYLGGKAKCVKGLQTGDFVGDSALVVFEFPPDGVINTTFKLMSSPGYTAKNVLNVQPVESKGCSLWVTQAELGMPHPCCEFVFELLCGFNPTYQIYDESCQ